MSPDTSARNKQPNSRQLQTTHRKRSDRHNCRTRKRSAQFTAAHQRSQETKKSEVDKLGALARPARAGGSLSKESNPHNG
jgi:hypothetical protein